MPTGRQVQTECVLGVFQLRDVLEHIEAIDRVLLVSVTQPPALVDLREHLLSLADRKAEAMLRELTGARKPSRRSPRHSSFEGSGSPQAADPAGDR